MWIQIWNLPIHWITKEVVKKIGGLFESVKQIIIPTIGSKKGRHMKIMVEVDLAKPFLRGTTTRLNGSPGWVEFRYEKCANFCYCCGRIG